uniref:Uncharacterized protein n=3 Tax=unclassified Microvirus TaxID=338099 RepID=A0AAU8AXL3_9VIRU
MAGKKATGRDHMIFKYTASKVNRRNLPKRNSRGGERF